MKRIVMLFSLLSVTGFVSTTTACANTSKTPSTAVTASTTAHNSSSEVTAADSRSSVAAPVAEPSGSSEESTTKSSEPSKEDAIRIAQTHLALKKASWGVPGEVAERDGKYYVIYDTPEREQKLIGPRVIVVDKSTGVASFQKRR